MIEVHCDLTAPADYISEIGGNNTVENLRERFTGALQTVNKKLSLITNTLAVFAYGEIVLDFLDTNACLCVGEKLKMTVYFSDL